MLGKKLFQRQISPYGEADGQLLLTEAMQQTVFPLVYSELVALLPREEQPGARELYFSSVAMSIENARSHGHLHELLSENGIPYVIIKGMAAAAYYPVPFQRTMGDVDFLVAREDLARTKELLWANGYTTHKGDRSRAHIAFYKEKETLEMHWEPNGVPEGREGDICRQYLADIVERAHLHTTSSGSFLVPSAFHHGLILLLHTATHMIDTGIGLRHICDWAVFAGSLSDAKFRELFEERLKNVGLWRFAQLLTQLSIRYLGCPKRSWAMEDVQKPLLSAMMEDIFNSGNFGQKDKERINEAKLMTSKETQTVTGGSLSGHLLRSLNEKAEMEMPLLRKPKARLLLPVGWACVGLRHLYLVWRGKKPRIHVRKMVRGARKRSQIYKEFYLFKRRG